MKILINQIKNYCINNNESIAVAENITTGCLQMLLGNTTDAHLFFQGGITISSDHQLSSQLGILPLNIQNKTEINLSLTIQMAKAVAKKFGSEIGIAVNGFNTTADGKPSPAFAAIVHLNEIIYAEKLLPAAHAATAIPIEYAQRIVKQLATQLMPADTDSSYYRIPA